MKGKIAVEPALNNVREYLAGEGYDVHNLSSNNMNEYDAIVVTGLNTNLSDIQDTGTKAVVINANGLSPEEVARRIIEI